MKCLFMDKGVTRKITSEFQEGLSDLLGKNRVKAFLQIIELFTYCFIGDRAARLL